MERAWKWKSPGPLWEKLKPQARAMRAEPTPEEDLLWERLRSSQVHGVRFRRQHTINRFVVDFYCAKARLIVEVDGPIHDLQRDEDLQRQEVLENQGFRFLRFTNNDVRQHLDRVVSDIAEDVQRALELSRKRTSKAAIVDDWFPLSAKAERGGLRSKPG